MNFYSNVNKAIYTTASVACGWAGAVMLKDGQKSYFYKSVTDGPMDQCRSMDFMTPLGFLDASCGYLFQDIS